MKGVDKMISPRFAGILGVLLENNAYVTVDRIAEEIGVSRRSVFRETDDTAKILGKYGLAIDAKAGKGVMLTGRDEDKARLAAELAARKNSPLSKRDRHFMLAFLMMDETGVQKLTYYALALNVSEATISLDMDALKTRLGAFNLYIKRKPGAGAGLTGAERDIRRAYASFAASLTERKAVLFDRPQKQISDAISELISGELYHNLDWMTEESFDMLKLQLAVMVERARGAFNIDGETEIAPGLPRRLAERLCDDIEDTFNISLSAGERAWAAALIRAARTKRLPPGDLVDPEAYGYARRLTYRMIDAFDANLSPSLKLNEDLVNGLSLHVWSAIIRIKQGIELKSVMREQIRETFPEVYEKSVLSAKALEDELGCKVSENEAAFIASHFGAALIRLREREGRRVALRAGVVCVAGIGVSYMMQSQIRERFKNALEVSVSDLSRPDEWAEYDLLISSIPLKYDRRPVIMTSPILTDEDYSKIRAAIKTLESVKRETAPKPTSDLTGSLRGAAKRFTETARLLENFCRVTVRAGCSFDELAKLAGRRFGSIPKTEIKFTTTYAAANQFRRKQSPNWK